MDARTGPEPGSGARLRIDRAGSPASRTTHAGEVLMTRHFLLAAALLSFSSAGSARDWVKYPAVTQIDHADEIFAIGDAHSDFTRLSRVMVAAGIIDISHRWRAGHAILVTTGDMIDKGPRALDVLRLLMAVRDDARRAGGEVVILAGNHEAEFLADPGAPKGQEFAKQLKAARLDSGEVGACKGEIGEFLCSLSFAARVGDWFFRTAGMPAGAPLHNSRPTFKAESIVTVIARNT